MATTAERVEQLLNLMRDIDLPTLLALDHGLHLLLEQKGEENLHAWQETTAQAEFCQRYPHIAVDPALFALVGRHPANLVEADKALIRESIARRLQETWYPIGTYVDLWAAYTLLHAGIAQGAGFNYRAGRRTSLQVGDGSFIPVYLHDLELQIGPERFLAKAGFSERLGVAFNLLGRDTVFARFKICFQEYQRMLSFESEGDHG